MSFNHKKNLSNYTEPKCQCVDQKDVLSNDIRISISLRKKKSFIIGTSTFNRLIRNKVLLLAGLGG